MNCPSCQSESSGDGKFCEDCGAPLAQTPREDSQPEAPPEVLEPEADEPKQAEQLSPEPVVEEPAASEAVLVAAPQSQIARSGRAKVSLDSETLNILLSEFASSDKAKLTYEQGRILADLGHTRISLDHLPLTDTQLSVEGSFGRVFLGVSQLQMQDSGVNIELDVGIQ